MKALQRVFCILNVLLLSACANTWEGIQADSRGPNDHRPPPTTSKAWAGVKKDAKDISNWAHGAPSAMGDALGPIPTGYSKKGRAVILKPEPVAVPESDLVLDLAAENDAADVPAGADDGSVEIFPPSEDTGHVWNENNRYNGVSGQLTLPQVETAPQSLLPQSAVSLSVEYNEDVSIFPVDGDAAPYPARNAEGVVMISGNAVSGRLAQQVFFDYGSAKVAAVDRRSIRKLAKSIGDITGRYRVNVVGHASKRVDHVADPVRRKVINFEMAQKRANAVTHELNDAGVIPDWVTSSSRGDEVPNPKRGNRTQEAADRRVDIYVNNN